MEITEDAIGALTKNLHIHTAFSEVGARAAASPVYTSQRKIIAADNGYNKLQRM